MKKFLCILVLSALLPCITYADCGNLNGSWSGVWQTFDTENQHTDQKINANITTDDKNFIIEITPTDDSSQKSDFYGTCNDNSMQVGEQGSSNELSGATIDNEITLIRNNNNFGHIAIHLSRNQNEDNA